MLIMLSIKQILIKCSYWYYSLSNVLSAATVVWAQEVVAYPLLGIFLWTVGCDPTMRCSLNTWSLDYKHLADDSVLSS